jgi:hypothetical protein
MVLLHIESVLNGGLAANFFDLLHVLRTRMVLDGGLAASVLSILPKRDR